MVEFHPDFAVEFSGFSGAVRLEVYAAVELLRMLGPQLGRPKADTLKGSKHTNMKELRIHADNGAWRVAFAFDLRRRAILLVGGDKAGVSERKFYRSLIDVADPRFDQHQRTVTAEREKY